MSALGWFLFGFAIGVYCAWHEPEPDDQWRITPPDSTDVTLDWSIPEVGSGATTWTLPGDWRVVAQA